MSNLAYFLGVDTGGSKTHALVADSQGKVVGFGKAGPGNHEVVGYEGVKEALRISTGAALEMAGVRVDQIAGAGFGVAGYDFPSERADTLDAIGVLGLSCPLEAVNDMVIGLVAGASEGWGVVIDAGSGTNCRGRTRDGREGMVTGCGGRFGEHGGGMDLVIGAIRVINYHWIRRGPPTRLSDAFIEYFNAPDLTGLIEGLTQNTYRPTSHMARMVFDIAQEGDAVARDLIAWLGRELGEQVRAVIRQLDLMEQDFEVVQIGSLFAGGPMLVEPMQEIVRELAPRARFVPLLAPPVVGGVLLGMQMAGADFRPIRERLIENAREVHEA